MMFFKHSIILVVLGTALVAAYDFRREIRRIRVACAKSNNLTVGEILELEKVTNLSEIEANKDLQCYARCHLSLHEIVSRRKIDLERWVSLGVANKKSAARLRYELVTCRSRYKGTKSCADYWNLYACINSKKQKV